MLAYFKKYMIEIISKNYTCLSIKSTKKVFKFGDSNSEFSKIAKICPKKPAIGYNDYF